MESPLSDNDKIALDSLSVKTKTYRFLILNAKYHKLATQNPQNIDLI